MAGKAGVGPALHRGARMAAPTNKLGKRAAFARRFCQPRAFVIDLPQSAEIRSLTALAPEDARCGREMNFTLRPACRNPCDLLGKAEIINLRQPTPGYIQPQAQLARQPTALVPRLLSARLLS